MVTSHSKVIDLIELIIERTDIASNRICLYRELLIESLMENERTLESYGFIGGEYNEVKERKEKTIFFYDYDILDNDDPILNCDYYYHDYKYVPNSSKPVTSRTQRTTKWKKSLWCLNSFWNLN